jgi:hypothetical protein
MTTCRNIGITALSAISFVLLTANVIGSLTQNVPLVKEGVRIHQVEPFDFIYPETKLESQSADGITVSMARNEYEPVTFVVISDKDYRNVTIEPVNIKNGSGNEIRADQLDIRVVKVWKQSGAGIWADKEVIVPELLLKDDGAPFEDSVIQNRYIPPSLPSTFKTNLIKENTKQIWLTIRTDPDSHPAGRYTGSLDLKSDGVLLQRIPLTINILPLVLPEPDKLYLIYFRGRLSPPDHREHLSREQYVKQLKDIRNHGFNGITLYDVDEDALRSAIDISKNEGFERVVIVMDKIPFAAEKITALRSYGTARKIDVYFYGADEPYSSDSKLVKHIELSQIIHRGGGKVVTAIDVQTYELLKEKGSKAYRGQPPGTYEPLDWPNYNLKFLMEQKKNAVSLRREPGVLETYYWQIMQESPVRHRLYAGYFLWRSGMDGIFPYCYQHLLTSSSPYNGDVYTKMNATRKARAYLVTYPSKEGPVPTLQWEALREGIDDVRYLTALRTALTRVRPEESSDVRGALDRYLSGFVYVGTLNDGRQPFRADRFRIAREFVIRHLLKLQVTETVND